MTERQHLMNNSSLYMFLAWFTKCQTSRMFVLTYDRLLSIRSIDGLLYALDDAVKSIGSLVIAHNPFCSFHNSIISFLVIWHPPLFFPLFLQPSRMKAAHPLKVSLLRRSITLCFMFCSFVRGFLRCGYKKRCLLLIQLRQLAPSPSVFLLSFVKSWSGLIQPHFLHCFSGG